MIRIKVPLLLLFSSTIAAQEPMDHAHMDHSQMDHAHMHHMMNMSPIEMFLMNEASGTSMNPQSWPMPMLMPSFGTWHAMLMANAFLVDTQQSGPRGGDKFYSPNMFMAAAEHRAGKGAFLVDLMFSLEPATVTGRRYPELFQTGETAFGRPIVDGQHPHNLISGFGVHYARPIAESTTLEFYFAPVGDPALGPVAYPHRASAMEIPQAVLGHHWQDSTHIANEVVTVGIMHKIVRLEASGFYGTEPGENRWTIGHGPINSWSTRLSLFPTRNWMAQVSLGRLARPEQQQPGDVVRSTASLHYTRPIPGGSWSTSLIWGRNHSTLTHRNLNAYGIESEVPYRRKNFFAGRAELVDKDELLAAGIFRIGAYTIGYTRDVDLLPYLETGIGANASAYTMPAALKLYYGDRPFGVSVYLRCRLRPKS